MPQPATNPPTTGVVATSSPTLVPLPPALASLPDRITAKLAPGPNGCIEWTGYRRPNGYGEISDKGTHLAHRWIYEHTKGPIPEGHDLDHLCSNRPCINPEHLEPCNHTENMHRQGEQQGSRLANLENGKPYRFQDPEQARAAAAKSAEVRRAKKLAKQEALEAELAEQQHVATVLELLPQSDLTAQIHEATAKVLRDLLAGNVPIRNGKEASDLLQTLDSITRLNAGQPTSMSLSLSDNVTDLRARLLERQAQHQPPAISE